MTRRNHCLSGAVLFLFLSTLAQATIVPRLDLPDLARSAELIVHGRVLRHWSAWDRAHRFIWTHYLLEVTESLKGQITTAITISEPGGAAEGLSMRIAAVPEYVDGEEVVVFLERTQIGYWRCRGWGQGKYTVVQSPGGVKRIRTNLAGLSFTGRTGASTLDHLAGMELDSFKRLVHREADR